MDSLKSSGRAAPAASVEKGWVHSHGPTLVELFRSVDAAVILLSLWVSEHLVRWPWHDGHLMLGLGAVALFTTVAGQRVIYRSWRANSLTDELQQVSLCWAVAMLILAAGLFLFDPVRHMPRELVIVWFAIGWGALMVVRGSIRVALRTVRRRGGNYRVAAIIGANKTGLRIEREIAGSTWMGLRLAGYYDDRRADSPGREAVVPTVGDLSQLVSEVIAGRIDIVYITLPLRAEFRIRDLVAKLRDSTVTVMYAPDFSDLGLLHSRWEVLAGMPMISVIDTPHQGSSALLKRLFDVVVGSFILTLIALPMLLIALAVRLESRGPALFKQKRYGLDGREFEIYKFRSMRVMEDGRTKFTQACRGDPRVTPLGAFLRRTSLDELPQFINVLQGRMSIIGPRPHPVALNESQRQLIAGYMLRHKVRPGITGWAQVNGCRGETDTPEKMISRIRYDLEYIDRWSLWLDLRILWMTIAKGFVDKNAY